MDFIEIQESPSSRSISDDDLCSDCTKLAYCPGQLSLCKKVDPWLRDNWPCLWDENGYSLSCLEFERVTNKAQNWVKEIDDETNY